MKKVTIRVVSTMLAAHTDFNGLTMQQLCDSLGQRMSIITGGATVNAAGVGQWLDRENKPVYELGQDVYTLCKNAEQVAAIRELAVWLKQHGKQDCVLFTVERVRVDFV